MSMGGSSTSFGWRFIAVFARHYGRVGTGVAALCARSAVIGGYMA